MTLLLVQLKDPEKTQIDWDQTFKRWQEYQKQSSLDYLRTIRENGFKLSFKNIQINGWFPTILNQVVSLNGKTFLKNPIVKYIADTVTFDFVLKKVPPYYITRIDIDLIEELGSSDTAQTFLNDLVDLADHIGCAIRLSDHAEVKTMVPCSLISLVNNERARTFPQKMGFKGSANLTHSTRTRLAFLRVQHQNQLIHFINCRGEVKKDRLEELCNFLQNNLPNDLKNCVLKMSLCEYVRSPLKLKKTTLNDLLN